MTDLKEKIEYEPGIYQLETTDPVMAGPEGIDNLQAKQLANRTAWLKQQSSVVIEAAGLSPDANNLEQLAAAIEILAQRSACIFGEIRMYSGDAAGIPSGWFVCDGENGTPDLRDKFVIGSKGLSDIGQVGGSTHSVTSADGRHNHLVSGSTNSASLSSSQNGPHGHKTLLTYKTVSGGSRRAIGDSTTLGGSNTSSNVVNMSGSGAGHNHGVHIHSTTAESHTHSVETMPPYYTVAFIQYRGV